MTTTMTPRSISWDVVERRTPRELRGVRLGGDGSGTGRLVLSALDIPEFADQGLCAQTDPELFFPDKGGSTKTKDAKRLCRDCPVRAACLEYALAHDERFGIWGGLSERERRKEKRTRHNTPEHPELPEKEAS